jgi:hypothetical protein
VGIGTDSPSSLLEVHSDTHISEGVLQTWSFHNGSQVRPLALKQPSNTGSSTDDPFIFHTFNSMKFVVDDIENALCINQGGKVGINRLSLHNSSYQLEVAGDAAKTTSGSWSSWSDDRIKYEEVLVSGPSALAAINQLHPQTYEKIIEIPKGVSGTWMPTDAEWPSVKDNYTWDNEIGVIAQNVRSITGLSPAVTGQEVNAEGTQTPLWINWDYIHNYHIAATKELSSQLDAEKAKTVTLETQVADLITRVTQLENS